MITLITIAKFIKECFSYSTITVVSSEKRHLTKEEILNKRVK